MDKINLVKNENELINQRLSWLIQINCWLLLIVAINVRLLPIIWIVGLLTALSVGVGTYRANRAIRQLQETEDIEVVSGSKGFYYLMPGLAFPVIYGIMWAAIFLKF